MRVAFFYDPGNRDGSRGGAELAMDGFLEAAPDHVQLTSIEEAETVVIGNCVTGGEELLERIEGKRVFRFHHDLARDELPALADYLDEFAHHIFTSPLHVEKYRTEYDAHYLIPPCPDLERFQVPDGLPDREGQMTLSNWVAPSKGGHLVSELIYQEGGTIDCYGPGDYPPVGSHVRQMGPVQPAELPELLWSYQRFVFLPVAPEPFCRVILEALVAGCSVKTSPLIGGLYWVKKDPEALYRCAEDFWTVVTDA